jgi:hypothetical protein
LSESELHLSLKQIVADELQNLGYDITFEPKYPPSELVKWRNYRPDLVGILKDQHKTQFVIVECETRPCETSFAKKNWWEIAYQTKLFEDIIRFILAIPYGNVSKVTPFRRFWELWQINTTTQEIIKISRCSNST